MGVLLILPLLVAGFLLCQRDRLIFAKLHRYEGQLLYLLAAQQGLICFVWASAAVSAVVAITCHSWAAQCITLGSHAPVCWRAFDTDFLGWLGRQVLSVDSSASAGGQISAFAVLVGCTTCAMPFAIAPVRFRHWMKSLGVEDWNKAQALLNVSAVQGLLLPQRIASSVVYSEALMLSMDDRKVYVGMVQGIGEPTETNGALETFAFWPMLSGYRDKDTLKVVYTYAYPPFEPTAPALILRLDNVVSVTPYDESHRTKVVENTEVGVLHGPAGQSPSTIALIAAGAVGVALTALVRRKR
ncbi:hypothetical protein [Luteibacter sp. 3190]|uniref:hypothetical protein n=1 Tax=Luteibacter sp. 3190 TaxID=2817736 RepID=UPI00285E8A0D|nr:hypothetical protein [Luteibacter sp. 3190]MDR6935353.1 hypothetical protein [Luteibacter sp. 3190]